MKTKLALGLLLLVAACGDDKRPDQVAPGSGGTGSGGTSGAGGSAGTSSGGTAGDGDGGEDNMMPGAPVVMVTSPDAVAHPNDGEVLVADEVKVLCRVTKSPEAGSQPVNPSTVQIQALDAGGSVVTEGPGTPTNNDNEYSADVIIASVPNGIVSFRCTASDTSEIPVVGEHMISTFVDHGPAINAKNPLPDSAHALLGVLRFEFTVDPAPLADGDDYAALSEVELEVNGIQIDVTNDSDNLYVANVALNDSTVFPTKPTDEVPVVIRATNVRTPTAGERFESYSFIIDGTGPVINITSPASNEEIIGGQATLEFTVVDELVGVDEESVVVEINEVQHRFDPTDANWTHGDNGLFTFRIDSRNVSGSVAQLTIDISAADTVGNTSSGESRTLFLDNQPPTVDLDPGNVRELREEADEVYCSQAFDPLGDGVTPNRGMPNDRSVITNVILPRVLSWDRTNGAPGQSYHYAAGTDPLNVYLYLQDQTAVPLTVDTDQNGICDDIDRELDLPFIRLNPIEPKGESYFGPPDGLTPLLSGCVFKDELGLPDPARPDPLCKPFNSDMTRIISGTIAGVAEPVIYGKGTITDVECTGGEWELTQFIPQEGWICLAAVAVDKKGNRGVSAPLRLCYDNGLTPEHPACVTDPPESAPACTGNCASPAPFGENIIEIF